MASKPARRTKIKLEKPYDPKSHETRWVPEIKIKPPGIKDLQKQLEHVSRMLELAEDEVRQLRANKALKPEEVDYLRERSKKLQEIEEAQGLRIQRGQ